MKIPFRKSLSSILVGVFVVSTTLAPILDAAPSIHANKEGSNTGTTKTYKKDHILKNTFDGKRLDRIRGSLRGKNEYKLLIESTGSIESITASFASGTTEKVKVKKLGATSYMVRIPSSSSRYSTEIGKLSTDIIPAEIAGYTVIEPEIFDTSSTEYFSGEANNLLWSLEKIEASSYIEGLANIPRVSVGVLDTGIDASHDDLSGNVDVSLSYDFIAHASGSTDDNGHGTAVAGVIGARVNGKGVFGVDPYANLISLKVLGQNGIGTSYDILEALAYAKERHIPVLNISFGGTSDDPLHSPLCEAITDLKNNGTITVVSAGNQNQEVIHTIPAACNDAITVGASNEQGTKASFSNYGSMVDFYAPGTNIYTTAVNNSYTTLNGTSFSAPLITGLIAKELSYNSNKSYDEIFGILKNNINLSLSETIPQNSLGSGNTSSTGIVSSGSLSTGSTLSGETSSGMYQELPAVDYSNYKYYSGTFLKNGVLYGNSLYSDKFDFSDADLSHIQIYTYNEYQDILRSLSGSFHSFSVPTSGLMAEWKLDGNGNDTSGNGNDATAYDINWVDSGRGNGTKAAEFNGTSSFLQKVSAIGLAKSNGEAMTANLWMKWNAGTSYEDLVTLRGQGGHNWIFYQHELGDKLSFHGSVNQNKGTYTPPVGEWIMATATVSTGGVSRIFVNGVEVSSVSSYVYGSTFTNNLIIGGIPHEFYKGQISDVRIYNRELSPTELGNLYSDRTVQTVSNATTVAYINNYLKNDPTATFYVNSGHDNYVAQRNQATKQASTDDGVTEKNSGNNGDPVNLATGEFAYDNTLMSAPGVKLPYELKVVYKNQSDYNGPLGFNWDHNYNQYLTGETNGNILYSNGQLGTFRFILSGSTFLHNDGLRARLVQSGSTYSIRYDNGDRADFNSVNRLSQIRDVAGNTLNFTYSGTYLSGVTDTLGHTFTYNYYDHNRLKSVTDFTGRKVEFSYLTGTTASGSAYDMNSIILTNATGSAKTINFEYSTGATGSLMHNITKLFDSKGQVYVSNIYDSGDRVTAQTYGSGTLTYAYTLSGSVITKNTVIDKLGHKTEYSYNSNGNNTSVRYYTPDLSSSSLYSYTYNNLGLIVKEKRPRGNGYTYTYDGTGNIVEKRLKTNVDAADSSSDLVTTSTYDAKNQKLSEILPSGAATLYAYDGSGNITSKTLSGIITATGVVRSIQWNYEYDGNGLLSKETTPEGKTTRYTYSGGQIKTLVRGAGSETSTGSFTYNSHGSIVSSTDGMGDTKSFTYTPFDLVSTGTTAEGIIIEYGYDANNNKIRETRYLSGGIRADSYFYYDTLDHLTGSLVETSDNTLVLTTISYDANGNITSKKVGSGAEVRYTYNEFTKPLEERIIMVVGDSSKDRVTSYIYDANNNLISKTDPRGYTTSYTYDFYDRLTRADDPQGNYVMIDYNKDNTIDTTTTYTSTGVIMTRERTIYDNFGHPIRKISYLDPTNSSGAIETKYVYSKDLEVLASSDGKNAVTSYVYDTRGNILSSTDPLGNISSTSYNKRDQKTTETLTPNTLTGIVTTSYSYDHDGRVISKTNTLGKTSFISYDALGNALRTIDEMGRITDFTRDFRGLTLTSTEYLSGQSIVTTSAYDDRGNLISLTDPKNHTTLYSYDALGENTKISYPDSSEINFVYDKSGNLISKTDPNGTTVSSSYDPLGRLTAKSIITGTGVSGVTSESYTYDPLGRLVGGTDSGSGRVSFVYDSLSRLISEGGSGATVTYAYDATNNLVSLTHPGGKVQTYTYDDLGRNTTIGYSGETLVSYAYSGISLLSAVYGNGRTTSYTYDTLQRLKSITVNTSSLPTEVLSYDDSSIIVSDGNKNYSYDSLRRLISASPVSSGSTESYVYDKSGNRVTASGSYYTVNALDQYTTLTGSVNKTLAYDNNGNLSSDGTRSFVYDYNNRLIQVSAGTGTLIAQYKYDVLGRRIQKSVGSEITQYIYAGGNIVQEVKSGGSLSLKKEYINGIGVDSLIAYDADEVGDQDKTSFCNSRVLPYSGEFGTYGYSSIVSDCSSLVSMGTGSSGSGVTTHRYYYHVNHLGSVIGLSNNSGSIVQVYGYDSFGKVYVGNGSGSSMVSLESFVGNSYGNTRLFTGREYDKETGLYFNRARYYDGEIGRFISRDPIGQKDQVNLYTYVGNSPVMYVDPSGKFFLLPNIIGGLASVALGAAVEAVSSYVTGEEFHYSAVDAVTDFAGGFVGVGILAKASKLGTLAKVATVVVGDTGLGLGSEILRNQLEPKEGTNDCGKSMTLGSIAEHAGIYAATSLLGQGGGKLFGKMMGKFSKSGKAVEEIVDTSAVKIHGNSLNSPKLTTLYELVDKETGEHLKYGITSQLNPEDRYTKAFMRDKKMRYLSTGTRREMHALEHETIMNNPRGPLQRNDH